MSGCASDPAGPAQSPRLRSRLPDQPPAVPAPQSPAVKKEAGSPAAAPRAARRRAPAPGKAPAGAPGIRSGLDLSRLPIRVNGIDGSEMMRVPAGTYLVTRPQEQPRTDFGREALLVPVTLPEFYIDRHEVTVEQFKKFDPRYDPEVYTGEALCPRCPAVAVTYREAFEYCAWTGKRLPTETEWEAAARGNTRRPYPWGARYEPKRANLAGEADGFAGPASAGAFPLGAGPFGAEDLVGNVWEWVATGPPGAPSAARTASESSDSDAASVPLGLVKGGGYRSPPHIAVLSTRNRVDPTLRNPTFGFRCAQSAP